MKKQAFDSCVTPTVLYEAEAWSSRKSDIRSLCVAQRKMERRMLGLRMLDRWSCERIRALTKVRDWINEASRKKLIWARKIREMDENVWARVITTWIPYDYVDRRRRGHPCIRWRDELSKKIGKTWWSMTKEQFNEAMIRHSNMN
ncbi:unnamed protein product [Haemonchus placei]|uniref:Endonuclease-reverse transcriptase n=1 Tax=Haemonchus placei TaxID=6290 RepID=A0A3P7SSK7_HAEPC|nr:unnamed protein product [Haemonchus placei]